MTNTRKIIFSCFFEKNFLSVQFQQNISVFTGTIKKDTNSRAIRTLGLLVFEVVHWVVVDAILLGLIMQVRAG